MKNTVQIFCIATLILTGACNSNNASKMQYEKKSLVQDSLQVAKPTKKFSDIQFASKYDTSCGMPISAGLEDTLTFKGKFMAFVLLNVKPNL